MWARLDDQLIDHHKLLTAGELLGKNGPVLALGFYTLGLMYANKHLTDGHLPLAVVKNFRQAENPVSIADALVKAGLWEKNGNGFQIHDFDDYNPTAAAVKKRRKEDRLRKAAERGS
jgi:hypothetical protein